MAPSRTKTNMDARTIMSVVTTTVGVVRSGGLVKLGVTPVGGFPAGVVLGSTPGGMSMSYGGACLAKSTGGAWGGLADVMSLDEW